MEKIEGRGGRMIEKGEEGRERYVMYSIILGKEGRKGGGIMHEDSCFLYIAP